MRGHVKRDIGGMNSPASNPAMEERQFIRSRGAPKRPLRLEPRPGIQISEGLRRQSCPAVVTGKSWRTNSTSADTSARAASMWPSTTGESMPKESKYCRSSSRW